MTSALRIEFEMIRWSKDWAREHGIPTNELKDVIWMHRSTIRRLNRARIDRLAQSIMDEWRHRFSDDGESGCDYIILEDNGESDAEIQDYCDSEVAYPDIYSQYDCTGRRFTYGIHWKRVPAGIVIIHRWGLDV